MITSRGSAAGAPPATIRPPFEDCANAVMARSVSPASLADRPHLHPERWGRSLDRAELARPRRYGGILKECHSLYAGRDLLEELQPFSADAVFIKHKTSSITAWPGESFDEAGAHRFGELHEHDRHSAGRLQQ